MTKRPRIWLLALAWSLVSLGLFSAGAPGAVAALEKPTLLGFTTLEWRTDLPDFAAEAGRYPAFFQLYWPLELGWPNVWAPGMLDELEAFGMTAEVEVTTDDMQALLSGGRDQALAGLAETVGGWLKAKAGRRILIAPLPEANLAQHAWGGDPGRFRDGYRRIRDAILAQGVGPDQVRFVFVMNGGTAVGESYADYYPGDEAVDIVGLTKLNRGNPWRDYEATFGVHIREVQDTLTRTKPILIHQTGSVAAGGDRDIWLRDMFQRLKAEDQVIGAIYFNRDKFEAGTQNDYRILIAGQLDPVVVSEYRSWSPPDDAAWIFDGRLDDWVAERVALYGSSVFVDTVGSVFRDDIERLAAAGITKGCNPPVNDRFCPEDPVTRGQMAAFLVRALGF